MKEYKGFINLNFPDNPYVIYTIRSSNEKDPTIYIGVTSSPNERAYRHAAAIYDKKFEKNPQYIWMRDVIVNQKFKVLFNVIETGYNEKDGYLREIEVIKLYKERGYTLLNNSAGGKGNSGNIPWNKGLKMSTEACLKLSKAKKGVPSTRIGIPVSAEAKINIAYSNRQKLKSSHDKLKKKIYRYSLNGDLLAVYEFIFDEVLVKEFSSSSTTIIRRCISNNGEQYKGFIWSYLKLDKKDFYSHFNN